MSGLAAPTAPILLKSGGNVQSNVNRLSAMRTPESRETASMGSDLQRQVDQIVSALTNPGALTELLVTNTKGAMIAWIGSRIVDGVTYEGGWFEDVYIGGTGPADAVITATGGGVTISGAAIKLTSNGLETDINNETLPEWGAGVSLVSIDTSTPHGDQSFIAPQAFGVIAWDGAAYHFVASIGDDGSGKGSVSLNGVGIADSITMSLNPAVITVTNGVTTTILGHGEIITPLIDSAGYKVSGTNGVDLSSTFITAVTITAGTLNYGTSLTVSTSATGVFGTPGAGQSNGTVVTGVTLNLAATGIVTAASGASVSHQWSKGLLIS